VIAGGQHLITGTADADEFLAEFLHVSAIGCKRERSRGDEEEKQAFSKK